jgi:valyl-tRNA synthetase
VWSWTRTGSIHRSTWPAESEFPASGDPQILERVSDALTGLRKTKSDAKASMKARLSEATVEGTPGAIRAISEAREDLRAAGGVDELILVPASDDAMLTVRAVLAEN